MLEKLGKDLEKEFEDIEFIGVQKGLAYSICTFNCNKTGTTFCANSYEDIQKRLDFIRKNFKPIFFENRA